MNIWLKLKTLFSLQDQREFLRAVGGNLQAEQGLVRIYAMLQLALDWLCPVWLLGPLRRCRQAI